MTYQGLPSYQFRYGPDGEPTGHTVFHPVTGEPRLEYTVEEIDPEGRPVAFTVENVEKGTTGHETVTYDDEGRLIEHTHSDGVDPETTTTYTWSGDTVTMKNPTTTIVYTLDADGNILTEDSAFSGTTALHTNLEFDDAPNPFTLTGGQMVQILSTNNAVRWTPDAGCEYVEELAYDGDLLVAAHAEGCGFAHDHTYEYAEF